MDEDYALPQKRNKAKNKKRNPYKRGGRNRIRDGVIQNEKSKQIAINK